MATDKKSDHYTSAQGYTDLDGMSRQFTFVDHDKKPTVSLNNSKVDFQELKNYRAELVSRIVDLSPMYCPPLFKDFIVNGLWNKDMLENEGVPLQTLRDLAVLMENTDKIINNIED